jgi:nuclear GTP-binding protein
VRLRHKIEKASSAKQKKQRKEAKKNPQWRSRLKKDPGIPNLFPYKAKLLAEVEENKRKKEEEAQRRREVAKAQRKGAAAAAVHEDGSVGGADVDEDVLLDLDDDDAEVVDAEAMDEQEDSNPMAALLASAQARAHVYSHEDDEDESGEDGDSVKPAGVQARKTNPVPGQSTRTSLPKQALADPIKAVSALLDRMQQTTDGIQRLIEQYQIPPLMTANTDLTSSFLVEVARKCGRLGRGGVPNLHSAALTVLSDLNEERLELPSVLTATQNVAANSGGKGEVQVVSQMAEPFRIEGLWGDSPAATQEQMVVEA